MDHNLDDSLTLETSMGVDFGQPEDIVVSEGGITLEQTVHEESIPMEFEHSEEQPILMDTTSEEMIDFMGDQFTLQEYSVQSDQTTGLTTTVESNEQNYLSSHSDTMIDLQFQPPAVSTIKPAEAIPPKLIAIKAIQPRQVVRKSELVVSSAPKQVAIAPKPPKLVPKSHPLPKQLAIAPKPIALVGNRGKSLVKKVSIANVVSTNSKGNAVLAHIGKQLIMVPSGSQKIKLVSPSAAPTVQYIRADTDKAQLIPTTKVSGGQPKPLVTKLYTVQGRPVDPLNQPAVITKLVQVEKPPRFVTMPQKNMPIAFGNKVLMATPSKQGLKLAKKQDIITIKSPTQKLLPAAGLANVPHSSGPGKQKVVITSGTTQNVILKTTAPPKPAQLTKDGSVVVERQKSQLHQINVPGKGIQYVRIFTNTTPSPKTQPKPILALNSKTFVLTDNNGNPIQMKAEKLTTGEPLSVVVAGGAPAFKATAKAQKLVKIAPVTAKTAQQTASHPGRSSQSLLAPLSPVQTYDNTPADVTSSLEVLPEQSEGETEGEVAGEEDSKTALRTLIESTVSGDPNIDIKEIEIGYKQQHSPRDSSVGDTEQRDSSGGPDDHPFIVIPAKYNSQTSVPSDDNRLDDSQRTDELLNMDDEAGDHIYHQSPTNAASETEIVSTDLGLRPRKACNCTKSQCLKLYCDCFANGEFCNRCNCCNCHNNLENEELRQKAIRGCLERNPNAFRPKIGKSKTGGPEIIRRHNKGCNCKRSGCLKNYCECYEAKIACTSMCKCVGCRNVEDALERGRHRALPRLLPVPAPAPPSTMPKQPCSFMTSEVIEAVCQCLVAAGAAGTGVAADEANEAPLPARPPLADPMRDVIEEFARCLRDIISAAHHAAPDDTDDIDEEPE